MLYYLPVIFIVFDTCEIFLFARYIILVTFLRHSGYLSINQRTIRIVRFDYFVARSCDIIRKRELFSIDVYISVSRNYEENLKNNY